MTDKRRTILVFRSTYYPGFKGGGPNVSIANLLRHLGDEFAFKIVTTDRDSGDLVPYEGVATNTWIPVENGQACYLAPSNVNYHDLHRLLRETHYDALYLNSFFDFHFTFLPLLAHRHVAVDRGRVVVAPRGEFSLGALRLKWPKKRVYIFVARSLRVFRSAIWHASTELERDDIVRAMGSQEHIAIAPNLPSLPGRINSGCVSRKHPGPTRVVFLSRISPKKHLLFALEILAQVTVPVSMTIAGPKEDNAYWSRCEALIARMPPNVSVRVMSEVKPQDVSMLLAEHDLFFLPTLGENYGHVIAEALAVGTPVLISDRTPWRNLDEDGIGWDLPLEQPQAFVQSIEMLARQSPQEHAERRSHVLQAARVRLTLDDAIEQNRRLFREATLTEGGRVRR